MFKSKKEKPLTETEKELKKIEEELKDEDPTSEEYKVLLERKGKLTDILATESEIKEKNAKKPLVDPNIIATCVSTIFVGIVAAKLSEGKIISGPLWDKFKRKM